MISQIFIIFAVKLLNLGYMNRLFFIPILLVAAFVAMSCGDDNDNDNPVSDKKAKVLIDTDMVEGFDDGVAMMMLLGADNVDVVGVTTVTGNTWVQEGAAYTIRQMEIAGVDSLPVVVGAEYPLREGRMSTLKSEVMANPGPDSKWLGAAGFNRVTDWRNCYEEHYKAIPSFSTYQTDASDFIIRMLHTYPGELTLLAIGPCTNIAKALMKEPGVERLAKEIVYMGGTYFTGGNTTTYAEFNVIFDPEATAVCLRAPFAQQTIVSLDVCNTVPMDKSRYDDMFGRIKDERLLQIFRNSFHYADFEADSGSTSYVWDVISAAAIIDKDIVTASQTVGVDVQDDPSKPEYGRTFVTDNVLRQQARILTAVDAERLWNLIYKTLDSPGGTHGPIKR